MNNKIRINQIKWMNKNFTNYMSIINGENYLPEVKLSLDAVIKKERERILEIVEKYFLNKCGKEKKNKMRVPEELEGFVKPFIQTTTSWTIVNGKSLKDLKNKILEKGEQDE